MQHCGHMQAKLGERGVKSSLAICYYLRHHLAIGEGIVSRVVRLSRCVCVRHISLGGISSAL